MVRHISYSYLHTLACPYAAFLRYEAAIKGPMTEYLALGNALHTALELAYSETGFDGQRAASIFLKEFKRIIDEDEVFVGYPKFRKMEKEGVEMLSLFSTQIEKGIITSFPLSNEKEFRLPYEDIVIVGKIDRVDYDPALGYTITDYKSGSKEPDAWFLRHNLQLTAYAWACQEIYGELPAKLVWHHLRNGKLIETERTQQDIDDLKRMVSNVLILEKSKMVKHRIFHEQVCNWCEYKGDICDDRELEEQVTNGTYRKLQTS